MCSGSTLYSTASVLRFGPRPVDLLWWLDQRVREEIECGHQAEPADPHPGRRVKKTHTSTG
jgi:hypothetical protein